MYLTKYLATKTVLIEFIEIMCCIFVKQLTTTIIFINPLLSGKSTIKSIEILHYFCIEIGNG